MFTMFNRLQNAFVDRTTGSLAFQFNVNDLYAVLRSVVIVMIVAGLTAVLGEISHIQPNQILLFGFDVTPFVAGLLAAVVRGVLQYLSNNNK